MRKIIITGGAGFIGSHVLLRFVTAYPINSDKLITFVKYCAGHDLRYSSDATKLGRELAWKPSLRFEEGLETMADWHSANEEWLNDVTSGHYQQYYEEQYENH